MIRLLRWLLGFVEFSFTGGFAEGFVSECFEKRYNIHNVRRKGSVLFAECPPRLYPYLRSVAVKNGGRLRIVKKHGLIFILSRLKNRWGIFVGIVVGILFLSYSSGFIWNIEIRGCEALEKNEIRSFLKNNGFNEGVRWSETDRDRLESLLLASFDEIAWAHINEEGTNAYVEIREAVKKPETVDKSSYTNVKAIKNGTLIKTTVYDGWAVRKKGDGIIKGDLLISGVYSGEKGVTQFAHARGEYIARVKEKFSLTVNRNQTYKSYVYEKIFKKLYFFGLEIPLYIGSSNAENADVSERLNRVMLNGKQLPLGIREKTVKLYKTKTKTLSDSELEALLERETEEKLKADYPDCEIIKKKLNAKLEADCATSSGYLICLEDIGEETEIAKKDINSNSP